MKNNVTCKLVCGILSILLVIGCLSVTTVNVNAAPSTDYFERSISGSTGWAACDLDVKCGPSKLSNVIFTLSSGDAFCILGEVDSYWLIKYEDKFGYIDSNYCMINLPDILPSIEYDITNAYSSIYKIGMGDIPNLTGEQLYEYGKQYNPRLERDEFVAPALYSTAKMIAHAEYLANEQGYNLKIYDTYRPHSVSIYALAQYKDLYNSDLEVQQLVNTLDDNGNISTWNIGSFLNAGVSSHNCGTALDVTLTDLTTGEEISMQTPMHELSVLSVKFVHNQYTSMVTDESIKMNNIFYSAGMGAISSEWWHFQDNNGYNRIKAVMSKGCDFQVTKICSVNNLTARYYLAQYSKSSMKTYDNYRLYLPENYENKPLMVVIPGMAGGVEGSYYLTGLYQYIMDQTLQPDCSIVFFYRPTGGSKIDPEFVKETVNSIPHTDLYYCGFSLGAWHFSKYLDVGDFKKAFLIDGYDTNFETETSLESVYVVQSWENYVEDYYDVLELMRESNENFEYTMIDLTDTRAHVECCWWFFAPNNEEYFRYKDVDFDVNVYNAAQYF